MNNSVSLDITSSQPELDKNIHLDLERAVNTTFDLCGSKGHGSAALFVCSDEEIRALNKEYRGIDAPTDVLSFPSGSENPESGGIFLGDIAISLPTALRQSVKSGHPLGHELVLLIVHGVLHLLGYDHSTKDEERIMWDLQKKVFELMGYSITLLPGEGYEQE